MQWNKTVSRTLALLTAVLGMPHAPRPARAATTHRAVPTGSSLADTVRLADENNQAANGTDSVRLTHRGFDTTRYPGDDVMRLWRQSGVYEWVGFYLPAPCHKDSSWSGARSTLQDMGWGLAVLYVGQQTWGHASSPASSPGDATDCTSRVLGAARGQMDGDDAIARTLAEGFPYGSIIFLDIEYMPRIPEAMRDYYLAWTDRLLDDGRYVPGFYAHTVNAEEIYDDVQDVFGRYDESAEPVFWISGGPKQSSAPEPGYAPHAFAMVWQGLLDVHVRQGGVSLPIDVSLGAHPSPSALGLRLAD